MRICCFSLSFVRVNEESLQFEDRCQLDEWWAFFKGVFFLALNWKVWGKKKKKKKTHNSSPNVKVACTYSLNSCKHSTNNSVSLGRSPQWVKVCLGPSWKSCCYCLPVSVSVSFTAAEGRGQQNILFCNVNIVKMTKSHHPLKGSYTM